MGNSCFTIKSPMDFHDVKRIKTSLDKIPGVTSVAVNEASHSVSVDFDEEQVAKKQLQNYLTAMGYTNHKIS